MWYTVAVWPEIVYIYSEVYHAWEQIIYENSDSWDNNDGKWAYLPQFWDLIFI